MKINDSWLTWAFLSAVFAALTAIFGKIGVKDVDSDFATLIRTSIVFLLLLAFVGFLGKFVNPITISGRTWIFLSLSAIATGASWVCYFRALQVADASRVAAIDKMSVVLVALFALIFLNEKLAYKDWCGIFMVAGGIALLSLKKVA